ncbi:MAG: riboflavin synthase [Deltaproteobacteria bacterium]|nr:riboflavin synthase [Deltaproteobacteria bacterium]
MFSGIIEAKKNILKVISLNQALLIQLERPHFFQDVKSGDSIAVNGVCLTLEAFDAETLQFTLGYETLNILQWKKENLIGKNVNLERSLRFGDRIHGHLVSGHVDSLAQAIEKKQLGESLFFRFSLPLQSKKFIWKKGSVAVQGVSLTVNELDENSFTVCLIPETLKNTNLSDIKEGEWVNLECDYLIKGITQFKAQTELSSDERVIKKDL